MTRLDVEWYDLRDIGNAVEALLEAIRDAGAPDWVPYVTSSVIGIVAILLWTILSVLAFIWIERRVVGLMQNRIGPNRVGPAGLLQPVADALKLLMKEAITTRDADKILFWLAPIVVFIPTIVIFAVIPFGEKMVLADLNVGVLFLIAIGSINTIAVFMAGWSSNNKYALLGAMRTIAMLISYEIVQVLVLLGAVLFVGSMRLGDIVAWQADYGVWLIFLQPLGLMGYIIAGAVEMNRSPMDIAEAESEIVAGYHTEYGGIKFGFFYQAEYLAGFAIARDHCQFVHGRVDALGAGGVGARMADLPRQDVRGVFHLHLVAGYFAAIANRSADGVRVEVPAAAKPGQHPRRWGRNAAVAGGRAFVG